MHKEIAIAANLWRKQIKNSTQDAGDFMINMFSSALKNHCMRGVTSEKLDTFEKELIAQCSIQTSRCITLYTDYHPDLELSHACKIAGIDEGVIPIKSCVHIEQGKVSHSFGYGKPYTTITV